MLTSGNVRQGERYAVKRSISFVRNGDPQQRICSGLTLDLSRHGCCLFSSTTLQESEWLRLWFLVNDSQDLLSLDAKVTWVSVDDLYGDSPYWVRAGLEFTELRDFEKQSLHGILPIAQNNSSTKRRKHLMALMP
jgi:hypothetical protein